MANYAKRKAKKSEQDFGLNSEGEPHTEQSFLAEALKRHDRGWQREEENIAAAYEDLAFRAGDQWPAEAKKMREDPQSPRPCLTINQMPQFVRQVTGNIRMMRPSVKVVPVDNRGDPKTAETLAGMIRYIENRSEAQYAYTAGADSQVTCGTGHWRVLTEYADQTTFNQELLVAPIEDQVSVIWDPDDHTPCKENASFCFVPTDITHDKFKLDYPDKPLSDFGDGHNLSEYSWATDWTTEDYVRIAEYFEVRPETRLLALHPDGSIDDLTGKDEQEIEAYVQKGCRIEEREGRCVYRSLISLNAVLDGPTKWPGRYIPIIRVPGEEVKIGRRVVRHGVIRFAKDSQRAYNYFRSAQTEVVALQPKAPFIGTRKNFEGHENQWGTANTQPWPYLTYEPDPKNNGLAPARQAPGVSLQGIDEGLIVSAREMRETIGLHDADLGKNQNEQSGKALIAQQRKGDVGTVVYVENFARAIRQTGRVLTDLIPHVYDTQRVIRVVGEDGKIDRVPINEVQGDGIENVTYNDVTVGAYDVVLDSGPSYSTKREEARESMTAFVQAAPETAALVLDLVAESHDWPNADKFAKRLRTVLPPHIQQMEAQESGEPMPPMPEPQPDPEIVKAQAQLQMKAQETQANIQLKQQEAQADLQLAMQKMQAEHALKMEQMRVENDMKREQMLFEFQLKEREAQLSNALTVEKTERDEDRKDFVARKNSERRESASAAQ
jgi:hypothetical protein